MTFDQNEHVIMLQVVPSTFAARVDAFQVEVLGHREAQVDVHGGDGFVKLALQVSGLSQQTLLESSTRSAHPQTDSLIHDVRTVSWGVKVGVVYRT